MLRKSVPSALHQHLSLLGQSREELTSRYDARFAKYIASYGSPDTFLLHQAESFRDAGMEGATVLDFGCGFGLIGAAFAALGANKVIGVDLDDTMIRRGNQLLEEWFPQDVRDRVELLNVNAFETDFAANSFDVVTCIESLSHVQSVRDAIGFIRRVIRPRGRVLVSDGNNSFYVPGRRRRRRIWDDWEQRVAAPVRRGAIQKALPNLDDAAVQGLIERTVGLSEQQTVDAARLEVEAGVAPVSAPTRRMMHPTTGYHEERELDPFELIRRFEEASFVGRLLLPHADYPQRLSSKAIIKRGLRLLYPASLPAFPGFRLLLTNTTSPANGT